MRSFAPAEHLHRLVKQVLDSGTATSVAEAEAMFRGYRLGFVVDNEQARDPMHQAALLTGVALARRVFLGGVIVSGSLDVPLRTPLSGEETLATAVVALGATVSATVPDVPLIFIGGGPRRRSGDFHVRTTYCGWRGGILPAHATSAPRGKGPVMPLATMLAAGLAVNEAFLHVAGDTPAAGHRAIGLSLWRPGNDIDWLADDASEPTLHFLPSRLWLIGLGHLGQAYLWGLGLLPYAKRDDLSLVLQDTDVITPATDSTSILTKAAFVGQKKTRAMAIWAESRGFLTAIHERLFQSDFHRQPCEPAVALCGLDNALGRQALDQTGFDLVIEAGLGRGHRDFRTMRLHTLPGARAASDIWKTAGSAEDVSESPAYQKMLRDGALDQCGVTLLAGKAVGAPFVGTVAASLALSELLRLLHGGPVHSMIDLDLQAVEHRSTVLHHSTFADLNPGYVRARDCCE